MDQVHGPQGGPWTGSTGVVHGPGSMFCIRPFYLTSRSTVYTADVPFVKVRSGLYQIKWESSHSEFAF